MKVEVRQDQGKINFPILAKGRLSGNIYIIGYQEPGNTFAQHTAICISSTNSENIGKTYQYSCLTLFEILPNNTTVKLTQEI